MLNIIDKTPNFRDKTQPMLFIAEKSENFLKANKRLHNLCYHMIIMVNMINYEYILKYIYLEYFLKVPKFSISYFLILTFVKNIRAFFFCK